jgi:hypothetical protein
MGILFLVSTGPAYSGMRSKAMQQFKNDDPVLVGSAEYPDREWQQGIVHSTTQDGVWVSFPDNPSLYLFGAERLYPLAEMATDA